MKKQHIFSSVLALVAVIAFAFNFNTKAVYNVDNKASKITWKGENVTGFHAGEIKLSKGSFTVENGKLTGGSFDIDMNSMTCTDLQGEYADKLVGHLKNDDFFGTAKYPTSKFVVTKAVWQGGNNYKVTGNMTIKDVTKEAKFNAVVVVTGNELKVEVKDLVIDRSEYGIKYGSGSFFDNLGDKTIYDNFTLNLTIVAKQ